MYDYSYNNQKNSVEIGEHLPWQFAPGLQVKAAVSQSEKYVAGGRGAGGGEGDTDDDGPQEGVPAGQVVVVAMEEVGGVDGGHGGPGDQVAAGRGVGGRTGEV